MAMTLEDRRGMHSPGSIETFLQRQVRLANVVQSRDSNSASAGSRIESGSTRRLLWDGSQATACRRLGLAFRRMHLASMSASLSMSCRSSAPGPPASSFTAIFSFNSTSARCRKLLACCWYSLYSWLSSAALQPTTAAAVCWSFCVAISAFRIWTHDSAAALFVLHVSGTNDIGQHPVNCTTYILI